MLVLETNWTFWQFNWIRKLARHLKLESVAFVAFQARSHPVRLGCTGHFVMSVRISIPVLFSLPPPEVTYRASASPLVLRLT
jgi:hypothetical protein